MKRHTMIAVLGLGVVLVLGAPPISAEEKKSARPVAWTASTAMLAVYGEYNEQRKGTLGPVKYTDAWDLKNASILATPILAATYIEGGVKKGVIAIQRQMVLDGDIVESHATAAEISVYVFAYNGKEYVFEKGRQKVTEAGAHGSAPGGKLIRIGRDKHGLLFEGGDVHQGFTEDYGFIINLSAPTLGVIVYLKTGESYEDWAWDGKLEFIDEKNNEYFVLKLTSLGAKRDSGEKKSHPISKVDYYLYRDGDYHSADDRKYATLPVLDAALVYNVGRSESRGMTMPTIPRKLLR